MSDNLSDRLQRAADRFVAASLERGFIYGTVGRQNENGSHSVVVAGRPNYLYVTVDGEQASTIARAGATPRVAGLPVRMKREQGELVIVDVNQLALGAFLSGGAGGYNVAFHHHNEGSGLEYAVNSSRLKPGRVRYVEALTVHIGEFAYSHGGEWRWWPGGNIDLTAVKPATADTWAWVLVGVDPSTNAAVAVAGASQAVGVELTVDQIETIAFNGYIPCGAVRVRADDTALNLASRYADARIWLDRLGASGGGDVAAEIDGATEKTTPDGTDKFGLVSGGLLRWLSWDNLAAGVQAALDALYFALGGRAGGQAAHGGTGSGDSLTLRGSAHATSGGVVVNDTVIAGTTTAAHNHHFRGTGFPVMIVERIVGGSGIGATQMMKRKSSASLPDGFGAGMFIAIEGDTGIENLVAAISGVRAGADNSGALVLSSYLAGTRGDHVYLGPNGNMAIGPSAPAASAKLDIQGTDGALRLPRLTTAQRDALSPANGDIIYNTTTATVQARTGGSWSNL